MISALAETSTGAQLLAQLGVDPQTAAPAGGKDFSEVLDELAENNALAAAYADGVTLYPDGCEYSHKSELPWSLPSAPLEYFSSQGILNLYQGYYRQCCMRADADEDLRFMKVWMRAPNASGGGEITYMMEFDIEVESRPTVTINDTELNLELNSDGRYISLFSIAGPGINSDDRHLIEFYADDGHDATFRWLNMLAI